MPRETTTPRGRRPARPRSRPPGSNHTATGKEAARARARATTALCPLALRGRPPPYDPSPPQHHHDGREGDDEDRPVTRPATTPRARSPPSLEPRRRRRSRSPSRTRSPSLPLSVVVAEAAREASSRAVALALALALFAPGQGDSDSARFGRISDSHPSDLVVRRVRSLHTSSHTHSQSYCLG